jgi:hypothetical protein
MEECPALRWDVRSARLTTFHSGKPSSTSWWQILHGVRAIKRAKRGAVVEESGLVEGLNILLSDQPARFDVVMTPDPRKVSRELPMPSIGTLEAVSQRMERLAQKMTSNKEFPTANRLAFGVTLFQLCFKREDALKTLAEVFPGLARGLRKSADFVLQIDHPTKEEVEDIPLEIHYLQKWYFAELKLDGGPHSGPVEAFTANVDFDISTGITPARKWAGNESAQIIPHLIGGATRVLQDPTW